MARDTPCARSDRGSHYDTSRAKPCRYTCTETLLPANTWIFATSHAHAVSPRSLRYHNYYTTGNATCHRQSTAPSVNDLFPSFNLTTSSPPSTTSRLHLTSPTSTSTSSSTRPSPLAILHSSTRRSSSQTVPRPPLPPFLSARAAVLDSHSHSRSHRPRPPRSLRGSRTRSSYQPSYQLSTGRGKTGCSCFLDQTAVLAGRENSGSKRLRHCSEDPGASSPRFEWLLVDLRIGTLAREYVPSLHDQSHPTLSSPHPLDSPRHSSSRSNSRSDAIVPHAAHPPRRSQTTLGASPRPSRTDGRSASTAASHRPLEVGSSAPHCRERDEAGYVVRAESRTIAKNPIPAEILRPTSLQ
jgi:hypothetical protein